MIHRDQHSTIISTSEEYPSGFLLIDKPLTWTSFDAIHFLKKKHSWIKKIGHAGTLDPLATGLLIAGVGKGTGFLTQFQEMEKEYHTHIQLGAQTSTDDAEGEVIQSYQGRFPSIADIEPVLHTFEGNIAQVPPAYSAVHMNGKRAYALSREGKEVHLSAKSVQIYEIQTLSYDEEKGVLELLIRCSKGTYIRSLARDIGTTLGVFGFISQLSRTRIGHFHLENAKSPKEIQREDLYPLSILS